MRVVPRDDGLEAYGPREGGANWANHASRDADLRRDAMRSWLASGMHVFAIDSRRRFGGHGRARLLLVDDMPAKVGSSEHWQALGSALRRHTVSGGLAQLSPEERKVVTLAYIGGLTNREIGAALGVSISTVRRRLRTALERLESYMSRTGTWLSVIVLAVAGYLLGGGARLGRSAAGIASIGGPDRLAAMVVVGGVTAAALGMVAINSDSTTLAPKAPPATTAQSMPSAMWSFQLPRRGPAEPGTAVAAEHRKNAGSRAEDGTKPGAGVAVSPMAGHLHLSQGCGGNPTNAPARSATGHPSGALVTHPTAGGCGP
jgi:DNA-binding CsgD family transcriptional regulator